MTLYELFLLLHVVTAIIWLGAGFVLTLLILKAERAGNVEGQGEIFNDIDWLAPRLFIPASLLTLVFGLLVRRRGTVELRAALGHPRLPRLGGVLRDWLLLLQAGGGADRGAHRG